MVYDDANPTLAYDPEWLAITRAFNPFMSVSRNQLTYPDEADARSAVKQEIEWVRANLYGIISGTGSEQEINRKTESADMVKAVESCQRFEITAPGGAVGGNSQREYCYIFTEGLINVVLFFGSAAFPKPTDRSLLFDVRD